MSEDNPLFRTVQQQMSQDARIQTLESVESTFDMRTAAAFLQLPGLRGFWPMSAFASGGNAFDQSGNVRTLTYNGNPVYSYVNLVPYIHFDGVGDYLQRADEAGLDILGTETYIANAARGLTIGGWFNPDVINVTMGLMTKGTTGAATSAYELFLSAPNGQIDFRVSTGAAYIGAQSGNNTADWMFCVGRYIPSTEVSIFVNNVETVQAVGVPAALPNVGAFFNISGFAFAGVTLPYDGLASLCFLCAVSLSDMIIHSLFNQTRQLFQV